MTDLSAEVWSAVGQVGAFLVAVAALVYAGLSSRKSNRIATEAKELAERSTSAAERSATSAEHSAAAALSTAEEMRRSNEATRADRQRAYREAQEALRNEVSLVRGAIRYASGQQLSPGRVLVGAVWVDVANNSTVHPAVDVEWRHRDHFPTFRLFAQAIMPGEVRPPHRIQAKDPFETADDNSEMVAGTEVRFRMAGVLYLKRGSRAPEAQQEFDGQ